MKIVTNLTFFVFVERRLKSITVEDWVGFSFLIVTLIKAFRKPPKHFGK